ncbi:50S ribosomal protein L4 [Caldivirga maquilingensis]|uniref:Large ribosomal subunit protein uL4 n=1 Tax=Caldivirga maquilingensis (strain ATCC 700844 / DSM 13496 / JCM 10307 / IC-167) TaxID=397948 RepID=A8MB74_CALMQ|nr:50S ribosomal protein L4 [Caldivirga maquilingensis]ABW01164.1 ribosomal protein L4/L1e [Caldivirga maquilingensis IC-167]
MSIDLSPLLKNKYEVPAKAKLLNLNGEAVGEVDLPEHFKTPIRLDLIRRAVLSALTARLQPKGTDKEAGLRTSAVSFGTGLGIARVPRIKGNMWPRARIAPNVVKGRRAHPPKVEKRLWERINRKERLLAIRSAIAATAVRELIMARGHLVGDVKAIPLVVVNEFEGISKAADVKNVFKALGVWSDVVKAQGNVRIRAGRGKMRGRRYKEPKSILVVVSRKDAPVIRAVRNMAGVDVVYVDNLSILHLAPGGVPGRLTLWTQGAIERLSNEKLFTVGE